MPAVLDLPHRLAHSYSALARGLLETSESDYPYEPFTAPFDPDRDFTSEPLRAALHLARFWDIYPSNDDVSGDHWFADKIAWCRDPESGDCPDDAVVYEHLQRAMQATLDGPLEAWYVTAWNKDLPRFYYSWLYIFGREKGGGLAGLYARLVWT